MSKKFLGILAFVSFLLSGAYADDILAIVSNGQLTSKSAGVKELSLEERMQVKGGYAIGFKQILQNEIAVLAIPTINARDAGVDFGKLNGDEITYDKNGNYVPSKSGLCGAGFTTCDYLSQRRLNEFMQVAGDPVLNALGFSVKRNIQYDRYAKPYVVFTYGVVVLNHSSGRLYRINSSQVLNNNMVIKELSNKYKETLEYTLGGWYVR